MNKFQKELSVVSSSPLKTYKYNVQNAVAEKEFYFTNINVLFTDKIRDFIKKKVKLHTEGIIEVIII